MSVSGYISGHPRKQMPSGALRYLGETIDWRSNLATRSIRLLMRRLRQAGFGSEFVSAAMLPDWWDQSCLNQPELLPEIEIRVGRFLAVPLSTVSDPESTLEPLGYPEARLRCVRDIGRDRLAPAIHAAMRIRRRRGAQPEGAGAGARAPPFRRTRVAPGDPGFRRQLSLGTPSSKTCGREGFPLFQPTCCRRLVSKDWPRWSRTGPSSSWVTGMTNRAASLSASLMRLPTSQRETARPTLPWSMRMRRFCRTTKWRNSQTSMRSERSSAKPRFLRRAPALLATSGTWPLRPQRRRGKQASTRDRSSSRGPRAMGDYATATRATKALYLATGATRILRRYFKRFVDVEGASPSDQELMRVIVPGSPLSADASSR